jgi:hypothetical protein
MTPEECQPTCQALGVCGVERKPPAAREMPADLAMP